MADTSPQWFAWCFSHGRMHTFVPNDGTEYPTGAWCTAWWVRLDGATVEEAAAAKQARFGDAQFLDHLPFEQKVEVINEREAADR